MYRQPTNKHRVLAMKDKFENRITNSTVPNNSATFTDNKNNIPQKVVLNNNNATTECNNANIVPYLPKQMNGSPKRVVKRSEAFRRDKNSTDSSPSFQRNFALRTSYRTKNIDDKIKLFDNNEPLQRSESFSDLYSKPRKKGNLNETKSLSLESKNDKCDNESRSNEVDAFKHVDKLLNIKVETRSLQETFKDALKKPLPSGPAPSKPPRTFLYSPHSDTIKSKQIHEKPPINKATSTKFVKSDPKYMLDKLETALRNNRMKFKRQERIESSFTSEEEESPKFDKKNSLRLKEANCKVNLAFEDKSEDILASTFKPAEESRKEKKWEPIYAEPFHHNQTEMIGKTNRNSLYYMSSPVLLVGKEDTPDFKD